MKQSSIEFLIEMTKPVNWKLETWKEHYKEVFQKAKEMHKQEIVDSFMSGTEIGEMHNNENRKFYIDAKQFYKNTYEKEN